MPQNRSPLTIALLFVAACARDATPTPTDAGVVEPVSTRAEQAACGGRSGCAPSQTLVVGKDGAGRDLAVVVLVNTENFETWLVAIPRDGLAERVRLISENVRLDQRTPPPPAVELAGDKRILYVEHLGDKSLLPEITATYEITVDPLDIVRVSERRSARPVMLPSSLAASVFPGLTCELDDGQPCDSSLGLPRIPLADAFAPGMWRTTGLGDCALLLDAQHGQPSGDVTASVRAMITNEAVYLEVSDDKFVTRGAHVDRVELTIAPVGWMPGEARVLHLTMDGAVASARDTGAEQQRTRAEMENVDPQTRRFRLPVTWSEYASSTARLEYVDTDDGTSTQGVLSSGPHTEDILDAPRCAAQDGMLRVERAPWDRETSTAFLDRPKLR